MAKNDTTERAPDESQPGGLFYRNIGSRRRPNLVPFNSKGQQLDKKTLKPLKRQDTEEVESEIDLFVNGGGAEATDESDDVLPGDEAPDDDED